MYGRRPHQRDASQWAAIVQQHQQRKSDLTERPDSGSEGGHSSRNDAESGTASLTPASPPRSLTRKRIDAPHPLPQPLPLPEPDDCSSTRDTKSHTASCTALPALCTSSGNAFTVLMGASHSPPVAASIVGLSTQHHRKRKADTASWSAKSARCSSGGGSAASEAGRSPQLFLDFGQALKEFTACGQCGFVYQSGLDEDEAAHRQRHDWHVKGIAFNGWHDEPPNLLAGLSPSHVQPQPADRLLRVASSHLRQHPTHAGKVGEIVARLNEQLGSSRSGDDSSTASTAPPLLADCLTLYFYVRNRRVIAAMTVRSDVEAAPLVQSHSSYQLSLHGRCAVAIGVEQIWVLERHRREGVASRMLDACRTSHVYVTQDRRDIAFSQPTAAGRQLAQHYTGTPHFLAYG